MIQYNAVQCSTVQYSIGWTRRDDVVVVLSFIFKTPKASSAVDIVCHFDAPP